MNEIWVLKNDGMTPMGNSVYSAKNLSKYPSNQHKTAQGLAAFPARGKPDIWQEWNYSEVGQVRAVILAVLLISVALQTSWSNP